MPKHSGHDERRAAFAAAAARVLGREGMAGLTVRRVAREAGQSTGALVHYFPSKKELFVAATEHAMLVVEPRMDLDEQLGGLEALRKVLYEALPTNAQMRELWAIWLVFWEQAKTDPLVAAIAQDRYSRRHKRFERLIRRAREGGLIDPSVDVDMLAQSAAILVDGIGIQAMRTTTNFSAKRQRAFVDLWIDALPRLSRRKR
jgi:AcrR family transcriptional regulator